MSDDINNIMEKYNEACKALESRGFDPFNMQNGIKNTENAPKYDPNRLFRERDRVEVVKNKGRIGNSTIPVGTHATVVRDEDEYDWVFIKADNCDKLLTIDAAYLKLVTPAEELEISRVFNDKKMGAWIVTKDNFTHAYFPYRCEVSDNIANSKEEAKAAAEAERDRLNAESRKETK